MPNYSEAIRKDGFSFDLLFEYHKENMAESLHDTDAENPSHPQILSVEDIPQYAQFLIDESCLSLDVVAKIYEFYKPVEVSNTRDL